jgi:hypothetical protein
MPHNRPQVRPRPRAPKARFRGRHILVKAAFAQSGPQAPVKYPYHVLYYPNYDICSGSTLPLPQAYTIVLELTDALPLFSSTTVSAAGTFPKYRPRTVARARSTSQRHFLPFFFFSSVIFACSPLSPTSPSNVVALSEENRAVLLHAANAASRLKIFAEGSARFPLSSQRQKQQLRLRL